MSKVSQRPNREVIKEQRCYKKQQKKALREQQKAEGLVPGDHRRYPIPAHPIPPRLKSSESVRRPSRDSCASCAGSCPNCSSGWIKSPIPATPGKRKHKLTLLMVYGLLMFVFQFSSRREVNKVMTRPQFVENLQQFFPELEKLPHADTLFRLLRDNLM